jgi:hypothetical protein
MTTICSIVRQCINIVDLAIDDLSMRTGICQTATTSPNTYRCADGSVIPAIKVCFFMLIYSTRDRVYAFILSH